MTDLSGEVALSSVFSVASLTHVTRINVFALVVEVDLVQHLHQFDQRRPGHHRIQPPALARAHLLLDQIPFSAQAAIQSQNGAVRRFRHFQT